MKKIDANKLLQWIETQKGFNHTEDFLSALDVFKSVIQSISSAPADNLSKCCNAVVVASMAGEGTGCYVCSKCNKPSDVIPFQPKTAEEIYVKWINDYNTGKYPDKTLQDIFILAMEEYASQF